MPKYGELLRIAFRSFATKLPAAVLTLCLICILHSGTRAQQAQGAAQVTVEKAANIYAPADTTKTPTDAGHAGELGAGDEAGRRTADSLEFARARQEANETRKRLKQAEKIAKEKRETRLKYPKPTYCSLGCGALSGFGAFFYYIGSGKSYDNYLAATVPDEAERLKKEAVSRNERSTALSYVCAGSLALGTALVLVREKVHPELKGKLRRSGIGPVWAASDRGGISPGLAIAWEFQP